VRILAIGDIHGYIDALRALAELARFSPNDQLIFLGDYIDRGPSSKAVIDWLLEQSTKLNLVTLRGNHEAMILEARFETLQSHLWSSYGGFETLISYNTETRKDWVQAIPQAHWDFFLRTKNFFETDTHIFVHGMVDSSLELAEQPEYILLWEQCIAMKPHKSGKKVICGHTPQPSGKPGAFPFGTCIDTGIYAGGWLTCLDVNTGEYWQANESGNTRTGLLEF
jgi:serine/threonine protein phosphatase 1